MQDMIIVAVILVIVGLAVRYIYKAKKSGAKCVGCAVGDGCCSKAQAKAEGAGCGCGCHADKT